MPTNSIKGFKVGNEVKKYDYDELDNLPENDPDDLAEQIGDLKSDLNLVVPKNIIGEKQMKLYPCFIPSGSKITMSTSDGNPISVNTVNFYFYDITGTEVVTYNFWQNNVSRTIQMASNIPDIYYVACTNTTIQLQLEIGDKTSYVAHFGAGQEQENEINALFDIQRNSYDNKKDICLVYSFAREGINGTTGETFAETTRLTSEFIPVYRGDSVIIDTESQKVAVYLYDTNKTYIKNISTLTATSRTDKIWADGYIRIVIANATDTQIFNGQISASALIKKAVIETPTNIVGLDPLTLYPVDLGVGDSITVSTFNGSTIDRSTVYYEFFNANKEKTGEFNFWRNLSERTLTFPSDVGEVKYIRPKTMPYIPIQLEKGNIKSSYNEYSKPVDLFNGRNNVMAIAHRGLAYSAPENTLVAFEMAYKCGFESVETDVRATSDGKYVLMHDESVDRTTNGTGNVSDLTLAEIQALDAGSWFSSYYTGTKVPTLEEFLLQCKRLGLLPNIELKGFTISQVEEVMDIAAHYGFIHENVMWISSDSDILRAIKAQDSRTSLVLPISEYGAWVVERVNELKTNTNRFIVSAISSIITANMVDDLVACDAELAAWVVDDYSAMKNLDPFVSIVVSETYPANRALKLFT